MKKVQHPADPAVTMIVEEKHPMPMTKGVVILAANSMIGIDMPGDGLVAYRKGDTAYAVGWWPAMGMITVNIMPLTLFEQMAQQATA